MKPMSPANLFYGPSGNTEGSATPIGWLAIGTGNWTAWSQSVDVGAITTAVTLVGGALLLLYDRWAKIEAVRAERLEEIAAKRLQPKLDAALLAQIEMRAQIERLLHIVEVQAEKLSTINEAVVEESETEGVEEEQ